jgi:hypothetical protein
MTLKVPANFRVVSKNEADETRVASHVSENEEQIPIEWPQQVRTFQGKKRQLQKFPGFHF